MSDELTIVMYHYVREIADSPYPGIKGLEIEGFRRQLDYLQDRYTIITAEQLIDRLEVRDGRLPENACLLTFDDGYKDHIRFVMPELRRRGLQGSFFPPARPILEHTLLDVNAVHHILACAEDIWTLVHDLKAACRLRGVAEWELDRLWATFANPGRFDGPEVVFVKRVLQRGLPEVLRGEITTELFERHVGRSEAEFCAELYLSLEDIRELIAEGMYVGSHTYNHYWLTSVDAAAQEREIDRSVAFLSSVGAPVDRWIMCYPYGDYNDDTLALLRRKNCVAGLTTQVGKADLDHEDSLQFSRLDTNDFPQ